jgi:hypothetical protein
MATQPVTITWRHDFDAAIEDAGRQQRNTLLDFSAAPM